MNLRFKLLAPFALVMGCIIALVHFYWLPRYLAFSVEQARQSEQKYLELLSMTLAPDLLSGDLARVYGTLEHILSSRTEWRKLQVVGKTGRRLFPLQDLDFSTALEINLFRQKIVHKNRPIGSIQAEIDIKNQIDHRTQSIQHLELVFLFILVGAALMGFIVQWLWIKRPLGKLAEGSARISEGDYDVALPMPSKDEIGELIQAFLNMKERLKEREEQLESDRLRTRAVINNAGEAIFTVDTQGLVREFNRAAEKIFGYSREEIIGQNVSLMIPDPVREKHDAYILEYIETNPAEVPAKGREMFAVNKAGQRLPIWLSLADVKIAGDRLFIAAAMDLSELKAAENELRKHRDHLEEQVAEQTRELVLAKEEAEAANKAKSEFLANMSHEIRTPINGIIGMAELLGDTAMNDVQRDYLEIIHSETNSLLDLINDILDFSKIEAGKMQLEKIPFQISTVVRELGESIAFRAMEKGLDFKLDIDPSIDSPLLGDPVRLRQVLMNLAVNALKFTHKGRISISVAQLWRQARETALRFQVTDTGIGIPEHKQQVIFESFAQVDASTTREFGGTGLGTTIAKQLVELMGGQIGLESLEGKGSTFWFTIAFENAAPQGRLSLPADGREFS